MKIGKAEWFLVGYIPIYLIVIWFLYYAFLSPVPCPGGCSRPVSDYYCFGIIFAVLSIIGIVGFLLLKRKNNFV